MGKKVLGIIPARGGSKGIPRKNIKPLLGKPLIVYTIEAAKKSGVFDRLIITTDDSEIAEVAEVNGCEVPFLRPSELAKDDSLGLLALQHAVEWLEMNENYKSDYVMVLQPTSPLRQANHIKESVDLIIKSDYDSVMSVSEIPSHMNPQKAMVKDENGLLTLINGDPIYKRIALRQHLPKAYWSVGSIYLCKTHLLFNESAPIYGEKVAPYYIDSRYTVDINDPEDWAQAEEDLKKLANE